MIDDISFENLERLTKEARTGADIATIIDILRDLRSELDNKEIDLDETQKIHSSNTKQQLSVLAGIVESIGKLSNRKEKDVVVNVPKQQFPDPQITVQVPETILPTPIINVEVPPLETPDWEFSLKRDGRGLITNISAKRK